MSNVLKEAGSLALSAVTSLGSFFSGGWAYLAADCTSLANSSLLTRFCWAKWRCNPQACASIRKNPQGEKMMIDSGAVD